MLKLKIQECPLPLGREFSMFNALNQAGIAAELKCMCWLLVRMHRRSAFLYSVGLHAYEL